MYLSLSVPPFCELQQAGSLSHSRQHLMVHGPFRYQIYICGMNRHQYSLISCSVSVVFLRILSQPCGIDTVIFPLYRCGNLGHREFTCSRSQSLPGFQPGSWTPEINVLIVSKRMNEFSEMLGTEDKKGKCYMTLWNPLLRFTKEKHKDSRRSGREEAMGSTAHRVQEEFKASEKSGHPINSREGMKELWSHG